MVRVLITGNKGFIGSYVMKLFPNAIGYDRKNGQDILNYSQLHRVIERNKVDTIIHLAALVAIPEGEEQPFEYIQNNVQGTMNVIDIALKTGVKKIVYASSSASYEPSSSVYAFTKYAPELLLDHYKHKIETVALRFFNVYGKGSNPAYSRVIDAFIEGIRDKGEINIYGDGFQSRDFIHVADIARAIKQVVDISIPTGTVMDLGTGHSVSVNWLAGYIAGLMNKDPKINYLPAREEVKHSKADITKMKDNLLFTPEITLQEGLEKLIMETI